MRKNRFLTRTLSLLLSALMLVGMMSTASVLFTASAATTVRYEKYTPNTSGQIIEEGRYIIQSARWNYVLTTGAYSSGSDRGLNASTNVTVTGNEIDAPDAVVVTITPVSGSSNLYTVKTDDGKYLAIRDAQSNNKMNAYFDNASTQLKALVYGEYIGLANAADSNNYCLNAHTANWFGGYSGGIESDDLAPNRLYLYKEIVETDEPDEPDTPTTGGGTHTETVTETVYEKYSPNQGANQQILEGGRYIIYSPARGYVFAGQAASGGGITTSKDFELSDDGSTITAPGAAVVTIATVQGQNNRYTVRTDDGKYLAIAASNGQSSASLSNNSTQLTVITKSSVGADYVAIGETGSNYFLNARGDSGEAEVFGAYAGWGNDGGLANQQNRLVLYREVTVTHTVEVPDEPDVPVDPDAPAPEGYHWAIASEVKFERYTPNTSGQIIEPGRYIFVNESRNYVLAGENALHGGITASKHYEVNGNLITASDSDVMTVVGLEGQNNMYYIHNGDGKYVSVYPASNQSAASMSTLASTLTAHVVNGQVEICEPEGQYALNAYEGTVFGVYSANSGNYTNQQNLLRLYREVTITSKILVPDYPASQSVGLDKTAEPIEFQETGLARVDLSMAGIPPYYSNNVDVLFITDVSNSMAWKAGTQRAPVSGETSKLQDMQAAVSAFVDAAMGPNEGTGMEGNNTVTFCTFGGWDKDRNSAPNETGKTDGTAYTDPTRTLITASADSNAVKSAVNNITFTMTGEDGANSTAKYYLTFDGRSTTNITEMGYGGTVYDYGFMEGYVAAENIKKAYKAETGEDYAESGRKIFVIFISDGAPTNYNGKMYKSPKAPIANGYYSDTNPSPKSGSTYSALGSNTTQQQWFDYISTNPNNWATKLFEMGQVAGMDTIGIDFEHGGFAGWIFTEDNDMDLGNVLTTLVDGEYLQVLTADDQHELANSLAEEAKRVSQLASYVTVEDMMGEQYHLQRASYIVNPMDGSEIPLSSYSVRPTITVTRQPTVHYVEGGANTNVGTNNGDPEIMEQVTFSDDGELAYSTLVNNSQTNIMTDSGVIRAHYFYYNTNDHAVDIDGINIPAESFHWNVGKMIEDKVILSYYVKLDGSEDYSVEDGIYPTNEYASLIYKDYEGRTITDYFEKPELEWSTESYVTVVKKWTDPEVDHDPITVQVIFEKPDGTRVNVTEPFTLSAENNWTSEVLTELSHLTEEGSYKAIDEVNGYYNTSGEIGTALVERNGQMVQTNHLEISIYNMPEETTLFEVNKTWSDSAVDDHADDPVEVELFCNGVTTGQTATLNAANNWSWTFTDLPLKVDGVKAEYAAQEITQFEDYASIPGPVVNVNGSDVPANAKIIDDGSATGIIVYEDAQGYAHAVMPAYEQTISNEIDADLLRLRITKKWSGNENHDPVTVSVGYRFTNGSTQTLRSGIVLSEDNDWNTVVSLHRPEDAGEYFLTEQNVPEGYVSQIGDFTFNDDLTAGEVTVYNVKEDKTAITAYKAWADGAENHTGEAIEVELYVGTGNSGVAAATGRTAMLNEANGWSYTFGGLDVKDENGVAYTYAIRENTTSALYTASYGDLTTNPGVVTEPGYELVYNGGTTSVSVYENGAGSVIAASPSYSQTVTNTPKPDVDTVELIVNKQWQDTLDSHGPIDCVVGYEAADGSVTVVSKSFTLSDDTDWSRKIEVAECDTATGRYVLLEPTVEGYEPITGGLEVVDTTKTVSVYVPTQSMTAGHEYVISNNGAASYLIGHGNVGNVHYAVPVTTGFTFETDSIRVGNYSHTRWFSSVPDNTVWTYDSNGYLHNGDNYMDVGGDGVYILGPSSTHHAITYTDNGWSGKLSGQYQQASFWGTRTYTGYITYNSSYFRTNTNSNSGTTFFVYEKVDITTGSTANAITATNVPKLGDQTVVIDYGLPVQVSVADYYATLGVEPAFVGLAAPGAEAFSATRTLPEGFSGASATYAHGTVAYANGKLTYTPTDMMMSEKEVIGAAFSLEMNEETWYLYGSVTVVPATIMYYEDDFVVYEDTANNIWQIATGANDGVYQGEDRPGVEEALAAIDADNVYGYDDANVACTTYSNGAAHWVKVKNGDYAANGNKWPTATFTFTGTAFDLISVTARETGYIFLDIYEGTDTSGARYDHWMVDTYYGYTRARDGFIQHEWYWNGKWYVRNTIFHEGEELPEIPEDQMLPANITEADTGKTYKTYEINYTWVPSESSGSLYQIPVIKSPEMPYNTYTVVVTLGYSTFFDHTAPVDPVTGRKDYSNGNYDFYLDAVRTYAPAKDYEGYNREYYTKDGEGWPQFLELRKNIISAAEAMRGPRQISGAVFFDSIAQDKNEGSDLDDYVNYGPDNEVYLAPGQSISFALQCQNNGKAIDTVQIGAKRLTGERVQLTASHTAEDDTEQNLRTIEIVASSDMYYNVGEDLNWKDNVSDIVTLTNVGQATVSITNVKITYKEIVRVQASFAPMNRRMLKLAASASDAAYIAGLSECVHRYAYTVTTPPTETATGVVTAVCEDCGNSFEIEIPALSAEAYTVSDSQYAGIYADGFVEYAWEQDGNTATFRVVLPALGEEALIVDNNYEVDFDDDASASEEDGEEDGYGSAFRDSFGSIRSLLDRILSLFRRIIAFLKNLLGIA